MNWLEIQIFVVRSRYFKYLLKIQVRLSGSTKRSLTWTLRPKKYFKGGIYWHYLLPKPNEGKTTSWELHNDFLLSIRCFFCLNPQKRQTQYKIWRNVNGMVFTCRGSSVCTAIGNSDPTARPASDCWNFWTNCSKLIIPKPEAAFLEL